MTQSGWREGTNPGRPAAKPRLVGVAVLGCRGATADWRRWPDARVLWPMGTPSHVVKKGFAWPPDRRSGRGDGRRWRLLRAGPRKPRSRNLRLGIWGSGVRISSGGPLRYKTGNAKTRRFRA